MGFGWKVISSTVAAGSLSESCMKFFIAFGSSGVFCGGKFIAESMMLSRMLRH